MKTTADLKTNMFTGIFFKTLKGTNGWSKLKLNRVDVTLINEVYYRKRFFMIFDRNTPYTLTIKYQGMVVCDGVVRFEHFITKRYETEDEVKSEILEIRELHKSIEEIREDHKVELLAKAKKNYDSARLM